MAGNPERRKARLASIALIHLPALFELEPAKSFDAIQELHLRLKDLGFPQGVSVLSAAAGAIIVAPDGVFSGEKAAIHHYFKELFTVCQGLPLRIGVTHGTVEFFEDVKGGTYIGAPINVAARVATALENRGLLYEKSYRDFRGTSGDRDSFRPKAGDGIKVKGKSHDGDGFVCCETEEPFTVTNDFSGFLPSGHRIREVSAFIVAVDLPRFSSGTKELLSKRFRAFVDAADKLLAENVVNELHYSPGGDGGVFVFPGVEPGHQAWFILDWFDKELAEEAKHQTEAASVKSRIGAHYGVVQLYKDGQGCEVPTGLACLLAEQIAKDIAAGSIAYSDKLWKDGGRWFNKDSDAEPIAPVKVPILGLVHRFLLKRAESVALSTLPFVHVREADVYAYDDPAAFSPSRREFEEDRVHRPALANQVQAVLIERRFACLLGKGASGKTTLALLLAFSKPFGPERSYYFDLAETDDSPDAAEPYGPAMQSIARQHGRDALVIVDNIHLAEGLAHKLHHAWREAGQPVRLLLQGRFTQQGADRRGRQSPLEELKRTALVLEVMPEDLAGVLQRLVRRANGIHSVSGIPPTVLNQWLKVFGGELIAFSSATRRKLAQIVRGHYQLTEADAADYIREEYLENQDPKRRISSAERENLLAVAACAEWELPVPAEGLPHPPGSALAVSMRRGLIWQSTHGRYGQFARYRLCHPGMGKLLWFAAKMNETNRLDQVCALAQRHPYFGCLLANRLARVQGDEEAAKRVLASVVSSADAFERLIEHGMVLLRVQCQQLIDLGVMSEGELDQKLAACKNLVDAALSTPLGHLWHFLGYAQTNLRKVWVPLANALAQEENCQKLAQTAFATPLHLLARFLQFAERRARLKPINDAIVRALVEDAALPADSSRLIQVGRTTTFEFLWGFVRSTRENPELQIVATAIEQDRICSEILNSKHRAEGASATRWSLAWSEIAGEYWDGEED